MVSFRSYRGKLQTAIVLLGAAAIAITGWEASSSASDALRRATRDRLNAVRETRARQIEQYFQNAESQLEALASDDSTVAAMEDFRGAWQTLPETHVGSDKYQSLREHYQNEYAPQVAREGERASLDRWFPKDFRARTLQALYIAQNPHPLRAKEVLLNVPDAGNYGRAHVRHHPTLHHYQGTFRFYDIFLIDAQDGRVLYTVFKEIDLGMKLTEDPYRDTALARAFDRAAKARPSDPVVMEDYQPYAPSYFAPAAFLAAPIWRGGVKIGVIAIQISIDEVNRVMTGEGRWREEGLGRTGHAYIVGRDGTLRSDVRFELENPEAYYDQLQQAGLDPQEVDRIRRYKTGILNFKLTGPALSSIQAGEEGFDEGADFRGSKVLRSHSRLKLQDLAWIIVAEIEADEAFAPIRSLQTRIFLIALLLAAVLFIAARWMAISVTRPVLSLAAGAQSLGGREFGTRVPVETKDEIGRLAESFNRMAENLEKTTVSREELEVLAGRLISAQEEERSRIARELHDDFSQRLAAIAIEAGRIAQAEDTLTPDIRKRLTQIREGVARLGDDIHGISKRLHPATLEDLGLAAVIESECRGFFERGGPPVDFEVQGTFDGMASETRLAIYRMVQESLRNIEKYAEAQDVVVRLARTDEGIQLFIRYNGRGFDKSAPDWHPGLGLASMEERAKLLDGRFQVQSAPGKGTEITLHIPWRAA